jgi:hypothetical protein
MIYVESNILHTHKIISGTEQQVWSRVMALYSEELQWSGELFLESALHKGRGKKKIKKKIMEFSK